MKNCEGGCLCGKIRFRVTGEPDFPHTCSCTQCQRHTGALSAVWVEYSSNAVEWIGEGGAPAVYRSSAHTSRAFCAQCGSSLGAIDDTGTVGLLAGVFDEPHRAELKPLSHSFEDMQPAWWGIVIR